MPLYEYDCDACHDHFEIRASMTAGPGELSCPACGSADVHRDYGGISVLRIDRSASAPRRPGELRPVDPRLLTLDVAKRYDRWTGDAAMGEVAKRVERGAEPDQLHEFVKEVKADRDAKATRPAPLADRLARAGK